LVFEAGVNSHVMDHSALIESGDGLGSRGLPLCGVHRLVRDGSISESKNRSLDQGTSVVDLGNHTICLSLVIRGHCLGGPFLRRVMPREIVENKAVLLLPVAAQATGPAHHHDSRFGQVAGS
jgi:hypothetical protein